MKKIVFICTIIFFVSSCQQFRERRNIEQQIRQFESSLIPSIVIEGEEAVHYKIEERMDYYNVPGVSIAVINNGKIEWAKGYGYTGRDSISGVDKNTIFQAASVSKPVAALGALLLVERGVLALDSNINDYLINWNVEENLYTLREKVTLRRLLSHSSGLSVHSFRGYSKGEELPGIIQVLNGEPPANSEPVVPVTTPGSEYRYSGGGYTVMQKVVSDVTGMPFEEFMNKNILAVLGMNNSTYTQPLPESFHPAAATGHLANGEPVDGEWYTYPEMAAAGLWTTPSDLAAYIIELQRSYSGNSNKILTHAMVQAMFTRQAGNHGLGPGLDGEGDSLRFGHGGANEGFRCNMTASAGSGWGVVVMTNSNSGGYLINEILSGISEVYGWNFIHPEVKKVVHIDPEVLERFSGTYRYEQDYEIVINLKDDRLRVRQLWDDFAYDLYPESDLTFFIRIDGSKFSFFEDSTGSVEALKIMDRFHFRRID